MIGSDNTIKPTVAGMGFILIVFYKLFSDQFFRSIFHQCGFLFLLISISVIVYIFVLNLIGLKEINDITNRIKNKLIR